MSYVPRVKIQSVRNTSVHPKTALRVASLLLRIILCSWRKKKTEIAHRRCFFHYFECLIVFFAVEPRKGEIDEMNRSQAPSFLRRCFLHREGVAKLASRRWKFLDGGRDAGSGTSESTCGRHAAQSSTRDNDLDQTMQAQSMQNQGTGGTVDDESPGWQPWPSYVDRCRKGGRPRCSPASLLIHRRLNVSVK